MMETLKLFKLERISPHNLGLSDLSRDFVVSEIDTKVYQTL